jgi:hypothetical protein
MSLRPALLIAAATILLAGCGSTCGNRSMKSFPSRDGVLKTVVFERDCGATTGFSLQVSLLARHERLPDDGRNLFVAVDNHGTAKMAEGGGVAVRWLDPHRLEIRYDHLARVFQAERHLRGVEISYVAD